MHTIAPTAPVRLTAAIEDKTIAIVSYLALVGFLAAAVMNGAKKTRLGAFHLRQSFGLMFTAVAMIGVHGALASIPFASRLVEVAWIGFTFLWATGLIAAFKGERKPVPLLGGYYQRWLPDAFE